MVRTLLVVLMVASGVGLGLQIVMNTRVRNELASPAMGAAVSLCVSGGVLAILIALGQVGGAGNAPAGFRSIPPWAWFGGVFVWKWHPVMRGERRRDRDFTPQDKPALSVIKSYYCGRTPR